MAEKEHIEREAAIAIIEEKQKELCPVGMYSRHSVYGSDREKFDAWEEIIEAIEAIPAADVRPVVTCADCKHWTRIKKDCVLASCDLDALVRCEDFYCANGEKREES